MGLLTGLLTLPLAPVRAPFRSVTWATDRLRSEAYRQMFSPEAARRRLSDALRDLEEGRITEQEYDAIEASVLPLMQASRSGREV